MGSNLLAQPETPPVAGISWAFVCRGLNGHSYLFIVDLLSSDTGNLVMEKMRNRYRSLTLNGLTQRITSNFSKAVLGTGIVDISLFDKPQTALLPDRAYRSRARLHVRNYSHDILLTDAFQQPELIRHITDFTENGRLGTPSSVGVSREPCWLEVVVINRVVDKHKVALLLLSILLVAIGIGIIVGISSGRPDIGVSIASGGFALVSALQALMAFIVDK